MRSPARTGVYVIPGSPGRTRKIGAVLPIPTQYFLKFWHRAASSERCVPMTCAQILKDKGRRGFTLLELIIAVVILAVLATIAIPTFAHDIAASSVQRDATSLTSAANDVRSIATSEGTPPSVAPSALDVAAGLHEVSLNGTPLVGTATTDASGVSTGYGNVSYDIGGDLIGYAMVSSNGGCVFDLTTGNTTVSWNNVGSTTGCDGFDALSGPGTTTSGGDTTTSTTSTTSTTTAPPVPASVLATIPVGSGPASVSSDGTHVWVANYWNSSVDEIDAATGAVVGSPITISGADAVSDDGTHVWVASNSGTPSVVELNAATGAVVNSDIPTGNGPTAISSDGTHVWTANTSDNTVTEIDAATGAVVNAAIPVGASPDAISSDGTHVWVGDEGDDNVTEIDAATGAVVGTIAVGANTYGISATGTDVWVPDENTGDVTEIDAATGTIINTISVGGSPYGIAAAGSSVWVVFSDNFFQTNADSVIQLNAATGATVGSPLEVGQNAVSVAADGAHVWVANQNDGTVSEILP